MIELSELDTGEHPLRRPIMDTVWHRYRETPRHQQTAIGPSEIGEPCPRKLAYKVMGQPGINEGDPLASILGTAAHSWMQEACEAWNEQAGHTVWLTEQRLEIIPGLTGSSDAYHVPSRTVVDWKFPGASSMKDQKANGPHHVYRVQAHLYGTGFVRAGLPVDQVAIVFIPRAGLLSGLHIWSQPHDQSIVDAALARYFAVIQATDALDFDHHPERFSWLDKETGHACTYCPWWKPGEDTGLTCPGFSGKSKSKVTQT